LHTTPSLLFQQHLSDPLCYFGANNFFPISIGIRPGFWGLPGARRVEVSATEHHFDLGCGSAGFGEDSSQFDFFNLVQTMVLCHNILYLDD